VSVEDPVARQIANQALRRIDEHIRECGENGRDLVKRFDRIEERFAAGQKQITLNGVAANSAVTQLQQLNASFLDDRADRRKLVRRCTIALIGLLMTGISSLGGAVFYFVDRDLALLGEIRLQQELKSEKQP